MFSAPFCRRLTPDVLVGRLGDMILQMQMTSVFLFSPPNSAYLNLRDSYVSRPLIRVHATPIQSACLRMILREMQCCCSYEGLSSSLKEVHAVCLRVNPHVTASL
jgi:hypothetical protein